MTSQSPKKGGCLKMILGSVIIVAVPCLLAWWFLNRQAEKRWKEAQAWMASEGIQSDWRDMLPPSLPDEVNYAALDPLWGAANSDELRDPSGRATSNRETLKDLLGDLPLVHVHSRGLDAGLPPDWSKAVENLIESDVLTTLPEPGKEAESVLQALNQRLPQLKQIVMPALEFTEAAFVPGVRGEAMNRPLHDIKYVSLVLPDFCRLLYLHGIAAVNASEPEAALADLRAYILLSKAYLHEPTFLNRTMGTALLGLSYEIVWGLMRTRSLDEPQLEKLQHLLSSMDQEKDFLHHMGLQMQGELESIKTLAQNRDQRQAFFDSPLMGTPEWIATASSFIPEWFFISNQAALVETEMTYIFKPFRSHGWAGMLDQKKSLLTVLDPPKRWKNLDLFFSRLLVVPMLEMSLEYVPRLESMRKQSIAAIALERFYLKRGSYPAQLDALVPEFLASVPLDPMDRQPIRYGLTADGRYRLWCIGMDGVDNNGERISQTKGLRRSEYKGDWVWQYEPVKSTEP